MTNDEEAAVIGRKYTAREEAQDRLARLNQKSLCMEATLQEVIAALRKRRADEGNVTIPQEFPTLEKVKTLLAEQAEEQATIREIDSFFAARKRAP